MNTLNVDLDLIRKYDVAGPRYTSYPRSSAAILTSGHWGAGAVQYAARFGAFLGSEVKENVEWREDINRSLVRFPIFVG